VALTDSPRAFGKPPRLGLAGLWRYRVQDFRIVRELRNEPLVVMVVGVGHRRDVYRQAFPLRAWYPATP
jgi:mRNA interferase RelE/StbE